MTAKNVAALAVTLTIVSVCCVGCVGAAGAAFSLAARFVRTVLP